MKYQVTTGYKLFDHILVGVVGLFIVLNCIFGLSILAVPLAAAPFETFDEQNAAKYEIAMFAEEWGLDCHVDQFRVGDPWTVDLVKRPNNKEGKTIIWTETDFKNLTDAVQAAEQDFQALPHGTYRDNQGK